MENNEKKLSTIGWVVRIAALLATVCFFFPFCTVSCSGQSYDITGTDIAFGISIGDYQSEGYFYFLFLLLIPILVAGLSFTSRELASQIVAIIGSGIDLILMIRFASKLNEEVESLYCTAEYSIFFYLNILCHLLMIGCSIGLLKWKFSGNQVNKNWINEEIPGDVPFKESRANDQKQPPQMKPIGRTFCTQCGEPLKQGSLFCTKCGHKVN